MSWQKLSDCFVCVAKYQYHIHGSATCIDQLSVIGNLLFAMTNLYSLRLAIPLICISGLGMSLLSNTVNHIPTLWQTIQV